MNGRFLGHEIYLYTKNYGIWMDCMRVLCMWPCLLAVYVINTGMHTARSECAVPNIRGSLSDE